MLVVGAGISGLSAAHYLKGRCAVTLVDHACRAGGWIETTRCELFLLFKFFFTPLSLSLFVRPILRNLLESFAFLSH